MGCYLLNPGDGHDVLTFDSMAPAIQALVEAREVDPLATLYLHTVGRKFAEYRDGTFYPVDEQNLPIKIVLFKREIRPINGKRHNP